MPMVNFSPEELEVLIAHTYGTPPWDDSGHPDHEVAMVIREKLERASDRQVGAATEHGGSDE